MEWIFEAVQTVVIIAAAIVGGRLIDWWVPRKIIRAKQISKG